MKREPRVGANHPLSIQKIILALCSLILSPNHSPEQTWRAAIYPESA